MDITAEGVAVGSPVDRVFIKKEDITGVQVSRFFPTIPSITIYSGRRRIVVRKLVKSEGVPRKKPLAAWIQSDAPTRLDIRKSMFGLKQSLETLLAD